MPASLIASLVPLLESHENVEIDNVMATRLSGGACQENYVVEYQAKGQTRRVVLRADAPSSLPGSISRAEEFRILTSRSVGEADVPTPRPFARADSLVRPDATGYLLPWVDGVALGRRIVQAPEFEVTRTNLPMVLADALSRIHSIRPTSEIRFDRGMGKDPAVEPSAAALSFSRTMIDAMLEPHPALEIAFGWLSAHAPKNEPVVLVHGDFRTGNFMITPSGFQAVLDWEFSHWGSAYEDLAWLALREWRFGMNRLPVGGFAKRGTFYAAYEKAARTSLDPELLHWWEVLGNVRWAAGCVYQSERFLSGKERDIELAAIGRRSAEMEWEALRLIERGPQHAG